MVGLSEVFTRYGFAIIAAVVLASASARVSKYNTSKSVVSIDGSKLFSISGVWSVIKSKSRKPTLFSSQRLMSRGGVTTTGVASTISSKEVKVLPGLSSDIALQSVLSIFSILTYILWERVTS